MGWGLFYGASRPVKERENEIRLCMSHATEADAQAAAAPNEEQRATLEGIAKEWRAIARLAEAGHLLPKYSNEG